jgi:thiamine-monophosphate kinase
MDSSDGLADALVQLASASSVRLRVDLEKVPVHNETLATAKKAGLDPLDWVLYGGEDYELVACISNESWDKLREANGEHNPFTAIGTVEGEKSEPFVTLTRGEKPGPPIDLEKCFQHSCPAD